MPLEYAGQGIVAEHTACREAVGLFDVSHLGTALIRGAGAAAHVDACLTNALDKIEPGRAQYTCCCDDATGGIVDDLIVYLRGPDEVLIAPNAANSAEVLRRLAASAPEGVEVVDRHESLAILAVQGPSSEQVLDTVGLPVEYPYMSFVDLTWDGTPVTVGRTGYTGERGYEVVLPSDAAGAMWDALIAAGEEYALVRCGLGARDTLRTEAGYPLHGQDLSLEVTPVQARLRWAVGWKKPSFWGREVLLAERERGPSRRLLGIEATGRGIPRPHMRVLDESGTPVGEVTTGTFSPTRRLGIGMALLDAAVEEGSQVGVDIRGRTEQFLVRRPPFVSTHVTD